MPTFKNKLSYKNYLKIKERELYRSVNSSIEGLTFVLPINHENRLKYQSKAVIVVKCTRYIEYLLICVWCLADECHVHQEEILQCVLGLSIGGLGLSEEVLQLLNFFRPLTFQNDINSNVRKCFNSNSEIFHATFLRNTKRRRATKCQTIRIDMEKEEPAVNTSKYLKTSTRTVATQTVPNISEFIKAAIKKTELKKRKVHSTQIEDGSVDDWLKELFKNTEKEIVIPDCSDFDLDDLTVNTSSKEQPGTVNSSCFDLGKDVFRDCQKDPDTNNHATEVNCDLTDEHQPSSSLNCNDFSLSCNTLFSPDFNPIEFVLNSTNLTTCSETLLLPVNTESEPESSCFFAPVSPPNNLTVSLPSIQNSETSFSPINDCKPDSMLLTRFPSAEYPSGYTGSFLQAEETILLPTCCKSPDEYKISDLTNDTSPIDNPPFSPSMFFNYSK